METLEIKNLTFYYPEEKIPALKDISMTINEGDFLVLFGRSGCGKSTLLRHLKPQLVPCGIKTGEIFFDGIPIKDIGEKESAAKIGFVSQSPENQIVTDKVWHELAFGLESLGYDTPSIRRRVAETASFFGIENLFYRSVSELSGGQKQILNLASVMVMQPEILILDEPTSMLDPIAASEFLSMLKKINTELGTAVILTEHRLEEALPLASKSAFMNGGKLLYTGTAKETGNYLKKNDGGMFLAMPAAMKIWNSVNTDLPCPVSVNEGRGFLKEFISDKTVLELNKGFPEKKFGEIKVSVSEAYFRYEKDAPDILRNASLTARAGEFLAILGGNGTGKTTTLRVIAGLSVPYRGEVKVSGRLSLLPQDPQTLFVKKTVYEDLGDVLSGTKLSKEEKDGKIRQISELCRLTGFEDRHPYDLSGGEQQRLALAKTLLTDPEILLLDEPTKGLDAEFKTEFSEILKKLLSSGICIIAVSHDAEFCAEYADRCALFFDGNIAAEGDPEEFFSGNSFYTTAANRISRNIIPNSVTVNDVINSIGGKPYKEKHISSVGYSVVKSEEPAKKERKKFPVWRKITAAVFAVISLGIYIYSTQTGVLRDMTDKNGITPLGIKQIIIYAAFIISLVITAICVSGRSEPPVNLQTPKDKRKLSRRTAAAVAVIILIIPLTLFIGIFYIGAKQYYLTAFAVLIECMLPFFMIFEERRPKARELVTTAVLCALGIAGRAAFFMLPQFKPVLALTVIAGVAFGGETGFLVGAVTMLASNVLFSQGPWTPWQMFAMGIIGFLAGILYRKGLLRRSRLSLSVFGAISAIVIYGGIMNPASVLIWGGESLNFKILISYYISGFPMDCVHAASTAVFLWLISGPILEKLDRIKTKYGLNE